MNLVTTLSELIAIPSVNPMGRGLSGPELYEYRVTDYLEQFFRSLDVPYVRQPVEPLRENIVARLDGASLQRGGPIVLFEAHQDTVPCDGMTIEPFTPVVRDGRIYGRGSCDIKGGMTAMLGAFARLARERPAGMPTLVMACTVNEEHGYTGAIELERAWNGNNALVPRRPDVAIIAEPTDLDVVVAHKGTVRWHCHTHGRAVHSSKPHLGDNAIYHMARVVGALEQYARQVPPTLRQHPLCGAVTLSVGTIRGGVSVNTVPDACDIEIDRRLLPGEDGMSAYRQVIDYIARAVGADFPLTHEAPYICSRGLADDRNQELGQRLAATVGEVRSRCQCVGVAYGTDAAQIASFGIPSVVFGPGSIEQAHTADEWLSLAELEAASEILYRFARNYG